MNQAQLCTQCGKSVGKAGSMTQWIFDPTKCSCSTSENKQSNIAKLCTLCGYPLAVSEGSITQWIFKPRVCTCLVTDQQIVADGIEVPPDDAISGDRYHFLGVAGHGGAGTVFKAKDTKLGRSVAVKVIAGANDEDPRQSEYFEGEARAASKLQHPNVVTVQDFGTMKDGRLFLVTEWIDGITLAQYLSRHGTLSVEAATEVFSQVLDALSHAHNRGVVHRDIKPNNIMLGRTASGDWTIKVIDFGTAREVDKDIDANSVDNITCSPFYMSPEQAGGNVDQRTDLYSVGCSLFEALVGKPPFTGHPLSVVMRHQTEPPPHLSIAAGREFPQYVEQLIAKALEKQPEDRFQSANDMKLALVERRASSTVSTKQPSAKISGPKVLTVGGTILVCAIAVGVGISMTSTSQSNIKPIDQIKVGKSFRVEEKLWDMSQVGSGRYFVNYDDRNSRPVELTPSGIRRLAKYKVTKMDLLDSGADDAVLRELGNLTYLQSLNVTGSGLTDERLADLIRQLPDLWILRANRTELTDAAIKLVKDVKGLQILSICSCHISAKAFDDIQSFPRGLHILGLSGTAVTDRTVKQVANLCPDLAQIELSDTAVTDACIPALMKWKHSMNTLYISNTKITDKGARQLKEMRGLKALSIQSPGVSSETLKYLSQRLPDCRLLNADGISEIDFY